MLKNKMNYKLLNLLMVSIIIFLAIKTFDWWGGILSKVFDILLPFLISFGIAYALYPCVRLLEKKGIRKKIANIIVILTIICLIILLVFITIPLVYEQLVSLSSIIANVIGNLSTKYQVNLGTFQETLNSSLDKIISNVGSYISNGALQIISTSVGIFTKIAIIGVVSIYLLVDMGRIRNRVKLLLKRYNPKVYKYVKTVDEELENYLLGLVIFMAIQLVEYSLLFGIVHHPNWLLLGILACVTTVIPYFGGLATNIIAVILASVVSPKLLIATIIICLVFPNVDGYIISPRVYGKTNNVNPIWAIFAVTAGGALFGFIGIVIALPTYIILKCTYNFFKEDIYGKIDEIKK